MTTVVFTVLLILNPIAAAFYATATLGLGATVSNSILAAYGIFATAGLSYALHHKLRKRA